MRYSIESLGGNVGKTASKLLGVELMWMEEKKLPAYFVLVNGLLLPRNQEGGGQHPTVEGHEAAAAVLCAELEQWLKD